MTKKQKLRLQKRNRDMAQGMIDATRHTANRPMRRVVTNDIKREVRPFDFRTLLSHSRNLYLNLGPARGAICDKAVYAVGRAWAPRFVGADAEWGKQAAEWLSGQWYGACDMAGGMQDFVTNLLMASIAIDRDGDCGIILAEGKNEWPMIQMIPAHRIWSDPGAKAPDGFYWDKGVMFSNNGAPCVYRIQTGNDAGQFQDVQAQNFIHLYDPEWFSQGRGMPAFIHAILDLQDYQTIQGYEKRNSMISSSLVMVETNENGAPDEGDMKTIVDGVATGGFTSELIDGGTIRYLKAGMGAKLEAWQSNRPSAATTEFLDRLLRNALVGIGWPYELLWSAKDARGANIRALVARAARTVEDRQDLLRFAAKRIIGYAVAKAIRRGILPMSKDWWRWSFTMPPHISVDAGYDAQADREDYKLGFKNLTDILSKYGKDVEAHLRERAAEIALIREIAKESGISPAELLSATMPSGGGVNTASLPA